MSKALRKLCLIPMLGLVLAAALSSPRTVAAGEPCYVDHYGCPDDRIDCCCGSRFICAGSISQCQTFCGD